MLPVHATRRGRRRKTVEPWPQLAQIKPQTCTRQLRKYVCSNTLNTAQKLIMKSNDDSTE